MSTFSFFSAGKWNAVTLQPVTRVAAVAARGGRGRPKPGFGAERGAFTPQALHGYSKRLLTRFHELTESRIQVGTSRGPALLVATESVAVDGARASEIKFARDKLGFEVVEEGRLGKVLLRAPGEAADGVAAAFEAARALHRRGKVGAAHPNFLRVIRRPRAGTAGATSQWNLKNDGSPGLAGADVHAMAVWTITKGGPEIRVAVLDEGVDTEHSYLRQAVVAERDFVNGNPRALPDANDAHGTACAGIAVSRAANPTGLAPQVSLVAARIAKDDGQGNWVFDDFDTADAIDWCWDEAKADVLSNSWGGGPPVDVIIRAFERARKRGRGGKGAVVVVAAGNAQSTIDFPGSLPGIMTVGASNEWDQRKTRTSRDGEDWWGSNYGDALDLLAPGVHIKTTDISGARGYSGTLVTSTFTGTSAATPHVAAAAALVLSVKPRLTEIQVRDVLNATADVIGAKAGWNRYEGHGRLNAYNAVWQARRL